MQSKNFFFRISKKFTGIISNRPGTNVILGIHKLSPTFPSLTTCFIVHIVQMYISYHYPSYLLEWNRNKNGEKRRRKNYPSYLLLLNLLNLMTVTIKLTFLTQCNLGGYKTASISHYCFRRIKPEIYLVLV